MAHTAFLDIHLRSGALDVGWRRRGATGDYKEGGRSNEGGKEGSFDRFYSFALTLSLRDHLFRKTPGIKLEDYSLGQLRDIRGLLLYLGLGV